MNTALTILGIVLILAAVRDVFHFKDRLELLAAVATDHLKDVVRSPAVTSRAA